MCLTYLTRRRHKGSLIRNVCVKQRESFERATMEFTSVYTKHLHEMSKMDPDPFLTFLFTPLLTQY